MTGFVVAQQGETFILCWSFDDDLSSESLIVEATREVVSLALSRPGGGFDLARLTPLELVESLQRARTNGSDADA